MENRMMYIQFSSSGSSIVQPMIADDLPKQVKSPRSCLLKFPTSRATNYLAQKKLCSLEHSACVTSASVCYFRSMTQSAKEAAKSWSSTLRLPKSTFPPRPAPADLAKYREQCTDNLYAWQLRERAVEKPFILHDGPPYANGDLHAGHALNKILKDIICRTKLQEGRRVDYVPGWDCHGLPIELKAFEHHGWSIGKQADAPKIRAAARAFAQGTVEKQMAGFKSWGVMADWANHWKTMDKDFELRQLSVFRAMAKNGLIYRRHKPVYWSPSSRTALAEAELEYKEDHVSTAVLIKFPLKPAWQHDGSQSLSAVIWTTTPWTLPANQAIAINQELEYVRVHSPKHGDLVVAKSRVTFLEDLVGHPLALVEGHIDTRALLSSSYSGPCTFGIDQNRPIIHADFVSADAGTGMVHCAPGHGMDDYEALQPLIRSGRVRVKAPVNEEGRFTEDASTGNPASLIGKEVLGDGNKAVLVDLGQEGSLLAAYEYKHKYPYDWRTKQPILIRATAQWFADVSGIKLDALKSIEDVFFWPSTGKARLKSFVQNRSEWCISRQRAWGVPIPVVYNKSTGEAVLSEASVSHIIHMIGERGIDAWWTDLPDDPAWLAPGLEPSAHLRGTDTMDVWFDSGTSWTHMLGNRPNEDSPVADVYIEGTDQHRGWFQSSLLTNVAYQKSTYSESVPTAPFRNLITHGFTLDGAGKKMSKSIGNVISPDQIITGQFAPYDAVPTLADHAKKPTQKKPISTPKKSKQGSGSLGPDALRLWVASSDWTKDVIVSGTIVKTVHAALHKYRVTFKLLLGALQDFDPSTAVAYDEMSQVDQIALLHLHQVTRTVRTGLNELEYHKSVTAINKWVNTDLSSFYIEAIKDILYCESPEGPRRKSVQTALYIILNQMQAMLAPLTPMLIEESWEHSPMSIKAASQPPLHRVWGNNPEEWQDERLEEDTLPVIMSINIAVKAAQERARMDKKMGSSLESDCKIYLRKDVMEKAFSASTMLEEWERISAVKDMLKEILVVSHVTLEDIPPNPTKETWHNNFQAILENKDGVWSEQKVLAVAGVQPLRGWRHLERVVAPNGEAVGIVFVEEPQGEKCARCWRYDIASSNKDESGLCVRCNEVTS